MDGLSRLEHDFIPIGAKFIQSNTSIRPQQLLYNWQNVKLHFKWMSSINSLETST